MGSGVVREWWRLVFVGVFDYDWNMDREQAEANGRARDAAYERGVTRLGELSSQLAQVHAQMVEETGALIASEGWAGDGGIRSVQHFLQVYGWLSPAHAHQLVAVARRRMELPETVELMVRGRLSLDQAAVVAQHVPAGFSAGGAELAEQMSVAQLRRTLSRYSFQEGAAPPPDPDDPPLVEAGPEVSINSHGRRFRLSFEGSRDDGAVVEQAIREAKDALFTAGNPGATLAEGFLAMAARSLDAVTVSGRRERYTVMIHLDVEGKGWLGTKGALPDALTRRLTCEGKITPVWEKDASPVAVGRSQRIVPGRTRVLIEDRDRGCRYPGCVVTAFVENHHLVHWADGGVTDPGNLLSLCPVHHRQHHAGVFAISGTPVTPQGLVFTTARGYVIGPVKPWPPPTPPEPTPPNPDVLRGDWCDTQWLQIPPNDRPQPPAYGESGYPGYFDIKDPASGGGADPPPRDPPIPDAA